MTEDVFISYSSRNREFADRIANDLRLSGISVFYDKDLLPGEEWGSRLEQKLRSAKHVLVLLSPAYMQSEWARKELELAAISESEGKNRIVPVLIESSEIPAYLQSRHFADLRERYDDGLALLKKAVTNNPDATSMPGIRWSNVSYDIFFTLSGLLGVALSSASLFSDISGFSSFWGDAWPYLAIYFFIIGLAITSIYRFRKRRRPKPLHLLTSEFEKAYISALEQSALNPMATRRWTNG